MDWALLTQTMDRLATLDGADFLHEIAQMEDADPELAAQVKDLRANRSGLSSFMQTRMPGATEVEAATLQAGDKVGVWQVAECLGAGGMGEVYRAVRADGLFEQQAALKIAKVKTKAFQTRFEAERQRLAQLEHPNIARIIDGGTAESGAPYMTMEFIDGAPIDEFAKANTLGRYERITLIDSLCSALSHAHGRLVLHRDIKHDNVLVNEAGEVRLIDFGVASLLDDTKGEGAPGPLTLSYAAPEQLLGKPVSAATDVFAVGMLIHLLEAGGLPKRQPDGGVAIDTQAIDDADLAAVLAKATAFDPADRYVSADALGDDLRKFEGGLPVAARPVSAAARFKKLVARNKLASAMSGAAIAAVVAGVIGVSVFAVRANEARAEAEYSLEQMEHYAGGESLRSEMMQRAFGKTGNQDLMAEAFLEYANEAEEIKEDQPQRAAIIKTIAGQLFMRRNDYPRAIAILEPWIEEGYGGELELLAGRGALARSYMDVGRAQDAIPLLRQVEAYHRNSPTPYTPDHAASASQLAIVSREPADIARGEAVLLATLEGAPVDIWNGYFYNQLGMMNRLKGNFAETHRYFQLGYEHAQENALSETTNLDTATLSLAQIEYAYLGDFAKARRTLDVARGHMAIKGESLNDGRAAMVEALMHMGEGNYVAAERKARVGLPFMEKFAGDTAPMVIRMKALIADALALQGRAEDAERQFSTLGYDGLISHEADEVSAHLAFTTALIDQAKAIPRVGGASELFSQDEMKALCTHPVMLRYYVSLTSDNLLPPIGCSDRLK